jgi:hypothetical protein
LNAVLILLFISIFAANGCSSDLTQTPDAGSVDMPTDVQQGNQDQGEEDATSPPDQSVDMVSELDQGAPDQAEDMEPTQGFEVVEAGRVIDPNVLYECQCPNPEDACTPRGSCVHVESGSCSLQRPEECPEGYVCLDTNQCFSETGRTATCERDEDCPFYMRCDHRGLCIDFWTCDSHTECPNGEICLYYQEDGFSQVCDSPGPKLGGESCLTGYECESGECSLGQCRQACLKNQDCPDDFICSDGSGTCTESPSRRSECPEGAISASICLPDTSLCYESSHCGQGLDCVVKRGGKLGVCETVSDPSPCKPNEVSVPTQPDVCFLKERCNANQPCPTNYECTRPDLEGFVHSWCARTR